MPDPVRYRLSSLENPIMLRRLKEFDQPLLALLAFAFALRCAAVVVRWENLTIDRDAYLAIAENLQAGNGFCSVPGKPTAFRPPLYPLLLAACLALGGPCAIAAVQTGLGTATVGLTWRLARNAGFSTRLALLAGLLTAVDPLLLEHVTQPMTETLFTFLSTALLCSLTRPTGISVARPLLSGLLIGLAALCRPSIWAFVLLWLIAATGFALCRRVRGSAMRHAEVSDWQRGLTIAIVAGLVVSPWVLRNWIDFGRPIVMTTHGGYTLALGNNERFFTDVVAGPENVWSEAGLQRWQRETERRLVESGVDHANELEKDAAMSRLAVEWIRNHPLEFASASWLRVQRFWAVRPQRDDSGSELLRAAIGIWYATTLLAAVAGLARHRHCLPRFHAVLLLTIALTLLHAVYWSNMRMRSPLVPIVSLFAASVFSRTPCGNPQVR
ncbi:hypothetical protein GC176_26785 [bacterium]|nr:hypothetical protein [bacterium]